MPPIIGMLKTTLAHGKLSDLYGALQQNPSIIELINNSGLKVSYELYENIGEDLGPIVPTENIMADQSPGKRTIMIRPAGNILNAAVEDACKYLADEELNQIVSKAISNFHDRKPDPAEVTNLIVKPCYEAAFAKAISAISASAAELELVNNILNGTHTFADSVGQLAEENYVLLPNIFNAIIIRAMGSGKINFKDAVSLLAKYDPDNLNEVVTNLRYGVNASLSSATKIGNRLNIDLSVAESGERKLIIGLNQAEQDKSLEQVREANQLNSKLRKLLIGFSTILKNEGIELLFSPSHFSFNYGQRSMCPVSGQLPYTEQVEFMFRVLAVLEKYL